MSAAEANSNNILSGRHSGPGDANSPQYGGRRRFRLLNTIPERIRHHIVAGIAEFIGTFLFLFFAFGGTQAVNTAPHDGQPTDLAADAARLLFISLSFGMSLAVNAWVFYRISGGMFNPAVSLAMVLVGAMTIVRGILVVLAQLLGAIAAAAVINGLLPGPLSVNTTLGGGISAVRGLFLEMFLTAQLVFTIFMLAGEKHRGTFMAPIGIGLSSPMPPQGPDYADSGVYYTGGSLNPARSFGPAVVSGSFPGYHWIYWLGPIFGSLLASLVYFLVKAADYRSVNPLQDAEKDPGESLIPGQPSTTNGIAGSERNNVGKSTDRGGVYEHGPAVESGEGSRNTA
ncbi:putative Aquaporin [Seiridium unicorne]|uniref:Aquaporin n=1 Tax=Seiridium unicorne TaxID=138068 RepID=A0ABR2VAB4_9PEZI